MHIESCSLASQAEERTRRDSHLYSSNIHPMTLPSVFMSADKLPVRQCKVVVLAPNDSKVITRHAPQHNAV